MDYTQYWIYNETYFNATDGIQVWTVPLDGTYKIEAYGGQGGSNNTYDGGKGAKIIGTFVLTKSTKINIVVGQQGQNVVYGGGNGGGGTFVYNNEDNIYIIAGGGGGASMSSSYVDGGHSDELGGTGSSPNYSNTPGNGGYSSLGSNGDGSGGAGWNNNGGQNQYAIGGGSHNLGWVGGSSGPYSITLSIIYLDVNDNDITDQINGKYIDMDIKIIEGKGVGQIRTISNSYMTSGNTRARAYVTIPWDIKPDITSKYEISKDPVTTGIVPIVTSSNTGILLEPTANYTGYKIYNNMEITIISGTGIDQTRIITSSFASDGFSNTAYVTPSWDINPDTTSEYEIKFKTTGEVSANTDADITYGGFGGGGGAQNYIIAVFSGSKMGSLVWTPTIHWMTLFC